MPDRKCAKCGFVMTELDRICPRCKGAANRPVAQMQKPVAIGKPAGPSRSTYDKKVVMTNRIRSAVIVIAIIAAVFGGKYAWQRFNYLRMTPQQVEQKLAAGDQSLVGKKLAWTGLVEGALSWNVNSAGQVVFGGAAYDADAIEHRTIIIKTDDGPFFAWDVDDKLSPGVEVTVIGRLKVPDDKIKSIVAGIVGAGTSVEIPDGPILEDCLIKQ